MEILLALFGAFIAVLCVGFVAFVAYDSGRHHYSIMLADAQSKLAVSEQKRKQIESLLSMTEDKLRSQDVLLAHMREANRKLLIQCVLLGKEVPAGIRQGVTIGRVPS